MTLASFLLGGASGSGVADYGDSRVRRLPHAGKRPDTVRKPRGPFVGRRASERCSRHLFMGAAAFLIAEFLRISYLDVILMAAIPTCLYYWSIFLMVELDAKKFGAKEWRSRNKRVFGNSPIRTDSTSSQLIVLVLMMVSRFHAHDGCRLRDIDLFPD